MASEDGKKKEVFDAEAARSLVKELRGTFATGKTKSYEWRVSQLKTLLKLANEHEKEIIDALRSDLSKPVLEAFVHEVAIFKSSCEFTLKELKRWTMPEKVKTSITTFPSSAEIVPEPLGVVLVISAWNYPFLLSLDPVIGAIAAGNAVVLKPSEIAPATSSLLGKLLGEYMDSSAVKVVEGAVPETSALLEQKWDKIFYTGNGKVGRIVLAAAAKHLTPVALELGGKCPVVVDSNINLKVTARRIIAGKWGLNNGQACVSADHLITTKDFAPKLIDDRERRFKGRKMSAGFLRNGSRSYHSIHNLLRRHSTADSIGAPILRGRPHQQRQSKAYARLPHSIYRKTRELELSPPNIFSSSFCSSTVSSSSKIGVVGWYLGLVKSHPILTKSITCAFIYTAADLSSQTIALPSSEPYDFVRTLRMAGYGMLIMGPSLHFWFSFVSKVLPKRDLITTFKKIVMAQTLYGPTMTVVFFSVNAALQGENGAEIIARLKRDLIPTMINGVMYWPICDFVTYKFIPVPLQPLVSNSFSYIWNVYMTYMASLEKARTS